MSAAVSGVTPPVAGHLVREYLGLSETFVYTTISFQTDYAPIVLARRTSNLDEFPFERVLELTPRVPPHRALARTLRAFAGGSISAYEHEVERAAARERCVLLHAHHGPSGCFALKARRRLGVPLVTTFYGFDLTLPRDGLAFRGRYRRLFAKGTLFTCEGPVMATRLAAVGCPADKIRVVRIPVDVDAIAFTVRRRTRPLVIVQAARFVEKKGVDVAIGAFAAARERLGPSELRLFGDGPERSKLTALAERLGVADSVRFMGMVSHEQYRRLLSEAHIGLQPSRTAANGDTEGGAPTALLEFQSAGVPVVSTRHADIPAVVAFPHDLAEENDVAALAERLVRLAEASEEEWDERARRGRRFVESHHAAPVVAAELAGVYEEARTLATRATR